MGKKKNRRVVPSARRPRTGWRDRPPVETNPEAVRYRRIKMILEGALGRSGVDRERFLEEACSGDSDLRAEVDSMLSLEERTEGFIEDPVVPRQDESELPRSRQVGPYRLLQTLGRGGMGVVYLAERSEEFEQRVAIKLIKKGMDCEEILGRFHYERQILANLVHPNIARLHDGGTTEAGQPYFVMEYVDGLPLDRYIEARRSALGDRLAMFLDVCRAVGFAHQSLVVHRDLKPANILVTGDGVPKLVDFGIAKLLGPSPDAPQTRFLRPFTREYASPEQLEKGMVSTRTDIYSLGVILYELLTGQRPYEGKESTTDSLLTAAREQVLTRPSHLVRRQVDGAGGDARRRPPGIGRIPSDLDAIVLKALRYEEDLRYASVDHLIADLERYRSGLPVEARQGSAWYRASKFLRRNAARLAMGAAVVGLSGTLVVAELRRQELERQSRVSVALGKYMVELFQDADPTAPGERGSAWSSILDRATDQIDRFLEEDPLIKAAFMGSMGTVYRNSGELDKAQSLLEECLRIRLEEMPGNHPLVATAYNNLANLRRAQGRYRDAEALLLKVLAIDRRVADGRDSENLAITHNNLAGLAREWGHFDKAVESFRFALAMKERLYSAAPVDTQSTKSLAVAHINLGTALEARGDLAEAEEHYRWALDTLTPAREETRENRANALKHLGSLLRDQGSVESADWMLRECLDIRESLYGKDPHFRTADCKRELARLAWAEERLDRAWEGLQEVTAIQAEVLGKGHPEQGVTLWDLARLEDQMNRPAAALESARAAAAIFEKRFPPDHWRIETVERWIAERSSSTLD